jgi:alpha-D-xyloside xylohydrolase
MYQRWALGLGSFTPIWKPHGPGLRFPWQWNDASQAEARRFGDLRMRLVPYNYSYAYHAHTTGEPMARPLLLDYQQRDEAWANDQEFLWGRELLVVPDVTRPARFWLPPGDWFDFWTGERLAGDQIVTRSGFAAPVGLYVRAGAIMPMAEPAMTPLLVDKTRATVRVQAGADGSFVWHDDDGLTQREARGERTETALAYDDTAHRISIGATTGSYDGAPSERRYTVELHGLDAPRRFAVDGALAPEAASLDEAERLGTASYWDAGARVAHITIARSSVSRAHVVEAR